jgi:uncharacterized radical SAM superfamily protein
LAPAEFSTAEATASGEAGGGALASTSAGFAVRRANFPDEIDFYVPGLKRYETSEVSQANPRAFLPVSLTGSACALACDHCKMKILAPMISAPQAGGLFELCRGLRERGTAGVLVSGGSDAEGGVPLLRHLPDIVRVRRELGMRVIVHSGLVTPETAAGLRDAGVEGVMMDVIGADETIHEVYHLPGKTVADFERSLDLLTGSGLNVIPHIILGLHYGRFLGEYDALAMVRRHRVSTLIVVVLTPLVGTPMANVPPPDVRDVDAFFLRARLELPAARVILGCARPLGGVKAEIDRAAVDHGLNGIAYPAEGIVRYAAARGLRPRIHESCCSLNWGGVA